jgi:hypothetical protein
MPGFQKAPLLTLLLIAVVTTVWKKPEAAVFSDPIAPHFIAPYRGDPGEPSFRSLLPKQ